jgi:hypothetical protein
MPATATSDWKELASRAGDGLEVSLFWSKSADRVRVSVSDARFEECFDLDIAKKDALAAFHHPFAYAAVRRRRASRRRPSSSGSRSSGPTCSRSRPRTG